MIGIRKRIDKINKVLLNKGYTEKAIIKFWKDCIKEAKNGKQQQ